MKKVLLYLGITIAAVSIGLFYLAFYGSDLQFYWISKQSTLVGERVTVPLDRLPLAPAQPFDLDTRIPSPDDSMYAIVSDYEYGWGLLACIDSCLTYTFVAVRSRNGVLIGAYITKWDLVPEQSQDGIYWAKDSSSIYLVSHQLGPPVIIKIEL